MGFGDFLNNFGKVFSDGFHRVADGVQTGAQNIWGGIKQALPVVQHSIEGVAHELKNGIQTIHQDVRDYVGGVANLARTGINGIVHTTDHIVDTAGLTVQKTAASLSMPLTVGLGAAAALGILVLSRK